MSEQHFMLEGMTIGILCSKEELGSECQISEIRAVTLNNTMQKRSTYALQSAPEILFLFSSYFKDTFRKQTVNF